MDAPDPCVVEAYVFRWRASVTDANARKSDSLNQRVATGAG